MGYEAQRTTALLPGAMLALAAALLIETAAAAQTASPPASPAVSPPPGPQKIIRYTVPFVFEFSGDVTFTGTKVGRREKYLHFTFEPTFASFIVKGFQIGGGPLLFFEYESHPCECDSGETIRSKPLGGGLQLFFRYVVDLHHAIFPFITLGQGFAFAEELNSDVNNNRFFVGPDLGLKIIFRQNGILTIFFRYQFTSIGYENISNRVERHDFIIGTGFGFWV